MRFFKEKISIFAPKIYVIYDPFFTKKPLFQKKFLDDTFFHSVRTFAHIRQHCFSKYWGGAAACMGPPHLKFFWGPSPQSPRSPPMSPRSLRSDFIVLDLNLRPS